MTWHDFCILFSSYPNRRNAMEDFATKIEVENNDNEVLSMYLREINRIPLISHEEEYDLAVKAKAGDKKDQIIAYARHNNGRTVVRVYGKSHESNASKLNNNIEDYKDEKDYYRSKKQLFLWFLLCLGARETIRKKKSFL